MKKNKTIPWEVDATKLSLPYIAGFLDGDGSIMATVERRPERRRFPYRVRLRVNFTQHLKHFNFIKEIQNFLNGLGAIRVVKSHKLVELVIQDRQEVKEVINKLLPFIVLKERQANIILDMIKIYDKAVVKVRSSLTEKEYKDILVLVQNIRKLNARVSGRIKISAFNPVTTSRLSEGVRTGL